MRTAAQCLAMALDMDRRAIAATAAVAADYRRMAASWRALARQAEWQDSFSLGSLTLVSSAPD